MREHICIKCKEPCYSAAEIENMTNPHCPTCGGEIKSAAPVVAHQDGKGK